MIDDLNATSREGGLHGQLSAAVQLRIGSQRMAWQMFGAFCATNAGLLIALFANGDAPRPLVGVIVSGAGLLLSLVSWLLVRQAAMRAHAYEELIGRIERRLQIEADLALAEEAPKDGIGGLIGAATAGAAVVWLVALALFTYAGVTGLTEAPATL